MKRLRENCGKVYWLWGISAERKMIVWLREELDKGECRWGKFSQLRGGWGNTFVFPHRVLVQRQSLGRFICTTRYFCCSSVDRIFLMAQFGQRFMVHSGTAQGDSEIRSSAGLCPSVDARQLRGCLRVWVERSSSSHDPQEADPIHCFNAHQGSLSQTEAEVELWLQRNLTKWTVCWTNRDDLYYFCTFLLGYELHVMLAMSLTVYCVFESGMQSLYFLCDSDSGGRKFRTLTLAVKRTWIQFQDVLCDILIVYLRMTWEKI